MNTLPALSAFFTHAALHLGNPLVVILVILLILAVLPVFPYNKGWGPYPLIVLVIVLLLLFFLR